MEESLSGLKRTGYCANIRETDIGKTVTVMGWVHRRRDLGKLIFILLRDRTGLVQACIDGNTADPALFEKAESVRGEYVLAITGVVAARTQENINPQMETGKVEIIASALKILSESEVPPFTVSDEGVKEDTRLKYRYLDLRRPELQSNLITRAKTAKIVRDFLSENGFVEVETPTLTKSTPEGARDYLVPSRTYPGTFFALPQSPQIFKQLLMVSGFDRYFQIVKCFRDEDLRADRQPEFTQIDIEMSFVEQDDIIEINEKLMQKVFKDILNVDITLPIQRMTYTEAMERYGSDKPDIRFGMEISDLTDIVKGSEFAAFETSISEGGSVRGICAKSAASLPRKQLDTLTDMAKQYGSKGLAWITITEVGEPKTSLSKFFSDEKLKEIAAVFGAEAGDLILIAFGKNDAVLDALGSLRLEMSKKLELTKDDDYSFLWVTEFPLFEWSEEDGRFAAKHHPFTSPMDEDVPLFDTDPGKMRAKAYDLVLNGCELGGGSVRIYRGDIQEKMFKALGFTKESAHERFGFLMDAFKYGAPPHGGIAFGFDRIVMFLTGGKAIRDVIAFPKVKDASCPMTDAPNTVDEKQLDELGLSISKKTE